MTYPKVCLRRGEETGVRAGKPWIFENQLDWADDVCEDGGIVDVLDSRMRFAARGYFNSQSKITVRVLTRDENEVIDRDFFRHRIERAWSVRRMLGFENSCRVVFGESDGLPGLTVDKFADCLSFQIVSRGMERWKDDIVAILTELFQPRGIYERDDVAVREKEGMERFSRVLLGEVGEETLVRENGLTLRAFARGEDRSPVTLLETEDAPKSISNSTTPPHDIENAQDARCIYYLLAESVGARLRRKGLRAQVVSVSALETFSCQCAVSPATNLTGEIAEAAMTLFSQRLSKLLPLRSVGLCCTDLTANETPLQIDMLGGAQRRMHTETLERSVDALRDRFGRQVIHRGIVLADREFAQITPAEEQLARPFNMSAAEGGRR